MSPVMPGHLPGAVMALSSHEINLCALLSCPISVWSTPDAQHLGRVTCAYHSMTSTFCSETQAMRSSQTYQHVCPQSIHRLCGR